MTLSAYNLNTQYQRTEISYETKISAVEDKKEIENKEQLNDNEIDSSSIPIIYTNESDLSNIEIVRKQLLEKLMGGFNQKDELNSFFPSSEYNMNNESYTNENPYSNNSMPSSLYYSSNSEYYEKTSFEFNAQATIKTPKGEYNIEIKFSFTQEFYEKNETEIKIANDNFKEALNIELENDDESLKNMRYLHFIFASLKEEKNEKLDIFEYLREMLIQRDLENKELLLPKKLDNFRLWQENSKSEVNLIAIQKDGLGLYLANSSNENSSSNLEVNENGYSFQSTYSSEETTYSKLTKQIDT